MYGKLWYFLYESNQDYNIDTGESLNGIKNQSTNHKK